VSGRQPHAAPWLSRFTGGRGLSPIGESSVNAPCGLQQLINPCQLPTPVLDNQQRVRLSCRLKYDTSQEVAGGVLVTNPDGVS